MDIDVKVLLLEDHLKILKQPRTFLLLQNKFINSIMSSKSILFCSKQLCFCSELYQMYEPQFLALWLLSLDGDSEEEEMRWIW